MCVCVGGGTSSGLLIENHGPSFAVEVPNCTCRSLSPGHWRWRLCRGQRETDACQGTRRSLVVLGSTLPLAYMALGSQLRPTNVLAGILPL